MVYLGYLLVENSLTETRGPEVRLLPAAPCGAHNLAKDRLSVCDHHCHLVCPGHSIVVPMHASCLLSLSHNLFIVIPIPACKFTIFFWHTQKK